MWKNIVDRIRPHLKRENLAKFGWYGALAALLMILGTASCAYRSRRTSRCESPESAQMAPMAVMSVGTPEPLEALFVVPTPSPEPKPEPLAFSWPVEGEIIGEFSMDQMVYSETLHQWQTHPGVDISAAAGEVVTACADGTVRDAWEDPLWGCVIEIEHRDGYVSTYANLSTLNMVKPGEAVASGQVIGAVGNTADCESALPWHLHYELRRDEIPVNPQKVTDLVLH